MPTFVKEPTPNPNSLKITSPEGSFIESGMESFNSAEEAQHHPLGRDLFRIRGVSNIFILPQFVTVTKHPAANWDEIMPMVEQTLSEHFKA